MAVQGRADRPWWMVGCLTALGMLAVIDKNIIVLMMGPIRRDLGLSATEITLAVGASFAIANLLISVPAGWLADRFDRRLIVGGAVVLWSIMAFATGVAGGFLSLFMLRAAVGMSEGLLPPASYSLLRDGVPAEQRARAFGIFGAATLFGTGVAFSLGAVMIQLIGRLDVSGVPVIGAMPPWGVAIALVGAAGLPLALLAATFPEPPRLAAIEVPVAAAGRSDVMAVLVRERAILLPLAVFSGAGSMLAGSINVWVAPMLAERFGLAPSQLGIPLGLLLMTAGPLGIVLAGLVIDRLTRRGRPGAALVAVAVSVMLVITGVLHAYPATQAMFWTCQGVLLLGSTTYLVVTSTIVSQVAPSEMTGRVISVFLVLQGLLGLGVAPTLTALLNDASAAYTRHPTSLAMAVMHGAYALTALAGAVSLLVAARRRLTDGSSGR